MHKMKTSILKYCNIIVDINNKKRFLFNDDLTNKIRASQGHAVDVELDYIVYAAIMLMA